MQPKPFFFLLLLGMMCSAFFASKPLSGEYQEIVSSVERAGGCCGAVNEDCGKCTPKGQMPGFEAGYSCCLPVAEKVEEKKATAPQYWCCDCWYPALPPLYGEPCCAGYC